MPHHLFELRIARRAAVCLVLASTVAFASTDQRVKSGIAAFDQGEFARARDALVTVVGSPALSREDRIEARSYLAAAYHALGDLASAKAQLLTLAREHPDARLDAGIFLPELIALADEARVEVANEPRPPEPVRPKPLEEEPRQQLAEEAPVSPPPLTPVQLTAPAPEPTRPSLALMFVPFGVGQFANDQNLKGTLFLAGEVVALGISGVALAGFESNKTSGTFYGGGTFKDVEKAQTLQNIHLVAGYTGLALMVGGVIDALISRGDAAPAPATARVDLDSAKKPALSWTFTGQSLSVQF